MDFGLKKRREVGQWPVTPLAFIRTGLGGHCMVIWSDLATLDLCTGCWDLLTADCTPLYYTQTSLALVRVTVIRTDQVQILISWISAAVMSCWTLAERDTWWETGLASVGATLPPRTGLAGLAEKIPGIVSFSDRQLSSVQCPVVYYRSADWRLSFLHIFSKVQ